VERKSRMKRKLTLKKAPVTLGSLLVVPSLHFVAVLFLKLLPG